MSSVSTMSTIISQKSPPNIDVADRFQGKNITRSLTNLLSRQLDLIISPPQYHHMLISLAWRGILDNLRNHFTLLSSAETRHNQELRRVTESIVQPFSTYEHFEKGGSVQDIGKLLHRQMSGRVSHSNNILQALDADIIPELKRTQELLSDKIGHIRGMSKDFDNDLSASLDRNKQSLSALSESIAEWETQNGRVKHDRDPFVVDLATRKDLRYALSEENYLRETTSNLEQSARALESIVIGAINRALAKYNELISREAAELATMSQMVEENIVANHLDTEWTSFTKQLYEKEVFVNPSIPQRSLETTNYHGKDHISTAPVCDGWLEKKSKLLGNYATAFYIISPSRYLHEFRSNDLRVDTVPTLSLYLPECQIESVSQESDPVHRFVLRGTQAGQGLHQEHTWVFRAKTREHMLAWYVNIGRASDPAFQYHTKSATQATSTGNDTRDIGSQSVSALAKVPELNIEAEEQAPFKGPETISSPMQVMTRPSAGRFDSLAFSSPWEAVTASLNAQTMSEGRSTDVGRAATTSYGPASGISHTVPVTYPEHDEHLRQASAHSAAGHFLDKEILDDNAFLEYDQQHGTHSTLAGDEDFKPADADVPVSRKGSVDISRPRRSSSLAFREVSGTPSPTKAKNRERSQKPPSRKATVVYGDLNNLPLPSMTEVNEAVTPEPKAENYISPYFPAPGAGTTGALPASIFETRPQVENNVDIVQPQRSSTMNSGANTPVLPGQIRRPTRQMSLSEQIMASDTPHIAGSSGDVVHRDLEPLSHSTIGTHDDTSSPYPAVQRFRVSRSRQGSMAATPELVAEPIESYDVAPHMRVGTQSNEARFKVGSRRGSRSASQVATPQEHLFDSGFVRSPLDTLSADSLASKLTQPSSGEKSRARRTPSRGASMDLGDGTASPVTPAFNVNSRHAFRKPPSRGSSLSIGNTAAANGDAHNLLNTISETFEKDLAAAKGNQANDKHVPGEFPSTPAVETNNSIA